MHGLSHVDRSRPVAIWLFLVAALVFLMVVVGGATRLTDSGLSITEWKPVTGAVPPLTEADWQAEFAKYRKIPEYQQVNRGMSLDEFKVIYWWEWGHRQLGRLIGVAFAVPFFAFLATKRVPERLVGRCWLLLGLGSLQAYIGWWMVSSGLSQRVDVAPERLTTHLGLALVIFCLLVWTGLSAWKGPDRTRSPNRWPVAAWGLLALVFVQVLLGGLVAGNDAGYVYNDWPLMNGQVLPPVNWDRGVIHAFLHDHALVQFNHRIGAYVLLIAATAFALASARAPVSDGHKATAGLLAALVWAQAALGVITLVQVVPLSLGVLHQAGAVVVLAAAVVTAWTVKRQEARFFV
jgi:cytochrome c oxidase assembly protein subunit 15